MHIDERRMQETLMNTFVQRITKKTNILYVENAQNLHSDTAFNPELNQRKHVYILALYFKERSTMFSLRIVYKTE